MLNRVISLIRSIWYWHEWLKLRLVRETGGRGPYPYRISPHTVHKPLVSVVVPTHNRVELLINRSLPSILLQTYSNLEVIVVAHGCTDYTAEIVRMLSDERIKVIELPREQTYPPSLENHWVAGRVAATNAGLAACTGQWIATNDDDDEWSPYLIETLLYAAQKDDLEFVSAGASALGESIPPYEINGIKIGSLQTWVYRSYLKSFKFNPQCWRKSWNRVCDTDLQQRFINAGVRMGFVERDLATIYPKSGNQKIGLAGARERSEEYLDHLAFTKE